MGSRLVGINGRRALMVVALCASWLAAVPAVPQEQGPLADTWRAAMSALREGQPEAGIAPLERGLGLAEDPERRAFTVMLLAHCYRVARLWGRSTPTPATVDRLLQLLGSVQAYDPDFQCYFAYEDGAVFVWPARFPPQEWMEETLPVMGFPQVKGPADLPPPRKEIHAGLAVHGILGDVYYYMVGDKVAALAEYEKLWQQKPDAMGAGVMALRVRRELGLAGDIGPTRPLVIANGSFVTNTPAEDNDRLLVPASALARRLGLDLAWNPGKQEVRLSSAHRSVVLTVGAAEAVVDGEKTALPAAPVLQDDEALVPLRFVAETFGREVTWETAARIAWVR
jgi:hypothetical protein